MAREGGRARTGAERGTQVKQRVAKRMTMVSAFRVARDIPHVPLYTRPFLIPHRLIRLQIFYDKYDTSQWLEHENLGRRAVVARRKPRAGRKRR